MNLEQTLQAIYDSELNVRIDWCWDGGFDFTVGMWNPKDGVEGKREVVWRAEDLAEALKEMAIERFPTSVFAREHGEGRSDG